MKYSRIIVVLTLVITLTQSVTAQVNEWKLFSPDKKITVSISNQNGLSYSVAYEKQIVIEKSPLGIQLDDQQFSSNLKFLNKKEIKINEKYTLLVGKRLKADSKGNELTLTFENQNKESINLIVRAFNDGFAFRYHFPKSDGSPHKIMKEESGFAIPKNAKAWIQAYDLNSRMKPCYETWYENGISPGAPSPNAAGWAFPALFNVGSNWILISEAGLDETYCASHLEDKEGKGLYTIRFPEKEEVTSSANPEPISSLPWTTPWRLAIIGPSLTTIQNTTLVTDLNPPSKIKDTSWIKPGRASWSWWSAGSTPRDFNVQKEYVDFNADMNWEYVLIDAGWPSMDPGKMEELVRYATSKGVGIFLWYHSGMGREKDSVTMSNLMAFPETRQKELARIKAWGVKGIKVDFFDSDKQPVIKRYMDILRDAAAQKIMVNFHGSTLPRGWERTYPHLMSMESVKGAEGAGRQPFCDMAPTHNTILPFTRNVVGPMDYTPVTFINKPGREGIRQTTFGHELALSIVFESGIFHFADKASTYQSLPDDPKKFLKYVPVTWDETHFVAGVPGQYVVIARRKGSKWYIGGINGQNAEQEMALDLSFINKNTTLNLITDGKEPGSFSEVHLDSGGKNILIKVIPKGGFVGTVSVGNKTVSRN